MFSRFFSARKRHSIILSRAISEMEQVQVTMTTDSPAEFTYLVQAAAAALQPLADDFQRKLEEADAARKAELDAARKGKK